MKFLSRIGEFLWGLVFGVGVRNVDNDDTFTIIFVSDLENRYRGHNVARSRYVVKYIRDLAKKGINYDGDYGTHKVDPELVIHGGDISHMWSCENFEWFILGGCTDSDDEFKDVWDILFDAKIPMISSFGNHDWSDRSGTGNPWGGNSDKPRDAETDYINRVSSDFVRTSYKKSQKFGVEYEEFLPVGTYGQSMYRATFRGFQIANFNSAINWQSYDENGVYMADNQFQKLSDSLDRTMKTLFFSHYPLNGLLLGQTPSQNDVKSLIREFEGAHHFSGHFHVERVFQYTDAIPNFNDYVAPYPHTWNGNEPGFYAILVSPTRGILQVKTINIPGTEDDEICIPLSYLDYREYFLGFSNKEKDASLSQTTVEAELLMEMQQHGHEFKELDKQYERQQNYESSRLGQQYILGGLNFDDLDTCNKCKSGKYRWSSSELWFVCGGN